MPRERLQQAVGLPEDVLVFRGNKAFQYREGSPRLVIDNRSRRSQANAFVLTSKASFNRRQCLLTDRELQGNNRSRLDAFVLMLECFGQQLGMRSIGRRPNCFAGEIANIGRGNGCRYFDQYRYCIGQWFLF